MFGRYFSICAPMLNTEEETVVTCALSWHQNSTVFYKSPLNLRIRKTYGLDGLPKSDVLKFLLEDNCSIVVRPSGTEPKLKIYISVCAENREAAEKVECEIVKDAENWFA